MDNIYLAMYKAKGNWIDSVIRFFTGNPYSHCEIAIKKLKFESGDRCRPEEYYECYSSSPRDGGVRMKRQQLPHDKWDLIPIDKLINSEDIIDFFQKTKSKKYDYLGALGIVFGTPEKPNRFFCSEWCYNLVFGRKDGYKISPNKLAELLK
ncbi:hypothetical protein NYR60_03060 [Actinobacillus genomosp. 2]|uniref:hypothetical protein n=1 Tax=Actinobacillus genomosp. 2 TaxID=230709 RepID=UPI0024417CB9|nr:hypothetical protein [Actinobacillus genomosp. 2]WGE32605.1 hypothetical protein NYR60_03060 [Actinobacillus genomosp. 2]